MNIHEKIYRMNVISNNIKEKISEIALIKQAVVINIDSHTVSSYRYDKENSYYRKKLYLQIQELTIVCIEKEIVDLKKELFGLDELKVEI